MQGYGKIQLVGNKRHAEHAGFYCHHGDGKFFADFIDGDAGGFAQRRGALHQPAGMDASSTPEPSSQALYGAKLQATAEYPALPGRPAGCVLQAGELNEGPGVVRKENNPPKLFVNLGRRSFGFQQVKHYPRFFHQSLVNFHFLFLN